MLGINSAEILSNESAKQGFFVGTIAGAVAWIVGSPLLGYYKSGDLIGKVTGALLLGAFVFIYLRRKLNNSLGLLVSFLLVLMTVLLVHKGGFTLFYKSVIGAAVVQAGENAWAFSFVFSYGTIGLLLGGFIEALLFFDRATKADSK